MSELKAYIGPAPDEKGLADYYLKSEVDKIFRRLKARLARKGISIQQLEIDKNNNWRKYCQAIIELRHNKRKRCLAMAKACHEKSERMYCEASSLKAQNEILGEEPKDAVVEKFELWGAIASTHRKIWLALAEEPTWERFLQLIHKGAK